MSLPDSSKKKIALAVALSLPVLLIVGGIWGLKGKHARTSSPSGESLTMNSSPQNVGQNVGSRSSDKRTGAIPVSGDQKPVNGAITSDGQIANAVNGGTQTVAGSPEAQKPAEPVETPLTMKEGCFSVTFKHKALASHASDDECSHHRNLVKLPRTDVRASSVCIRVNGNPVRHEAISGKPGEFVIGAVAGPKDAITARFCVGKSKCSEACPYPKQEAVKKDEFLEAISGGSNEDTSVAQWEADDVKKNNEVNQALDGDLKKAVEEQELASQRTAAGNSKLEIFKDWIGGDIAMACGTHVGEASRSTASVEVAQNGGKAKEHEHR